MDNQLTREEVTDALQQLRQGQGVAAAKLLQRLPEHYLAEALAREIEDGECNCDSYFIDSMDSVLWRSMRFQEQAS